MWLCLSHCTPSNHTDEFEHVHYRSNNVAVEQNYISLVQVFSAKLSSPPMVVRKILVWSPEAKSNSPEEFDGYKQSIETIEQSPASVGRLATEDPSQYTWTWAGLRTSSYFTLLGQASNMPHIAGFGFCHRSRHVDSLTAPNKKNIMCFRDCVTPIIT